MSEHYYEIIRQFIHAIGIEMEMRPLKPEDCFLPGLLIEQGKIIIDRKGLSYPGDLLHEAAHLAVVPGKERALLDGKAIGARKDAAAEEIMAIAWSYAACIHLDIDPEYVFHKDGYKGGGTSIVANFKEGNYFGVPLLQWLGMTSSDPSGNRPLYPAMEKWLRE